MGCGNSCLLPVCGDGVVDPGEACDDGNDVATDDCLNDCTAASCGDGAVWDGVEACDDGNATDGDACSTRCRVNVLTNGDFSAGMEDDPWQVEAQEAEQMAPVAVGDSDFAELLRMDAEREG